MTSCDGHVPSNYYPCPGTSTRGSELWLRENLRIDAADGGAGATVHTEGAYQLQGEVITVTGLGEHRSGGVLRDGVLTLGGWIYEEVP